MQEGYWGKKPLLYSIRFHQKQLARYQRRGTEENTEASQALNKMARQLQRMETELRERAFDPLVCYHFQDRLARFEHRLLRWQNRFERQPMMVSTSQSEESAAGSVAEISPKRVPIGKHQLPPLPYAYDALEPYIDEKTMRLHHDKHHRSYVEGLNKAETEMEKARQTGDFRLIKHWEREAAFNGSGHYLHTIFWHIMHPEGGGKPSGSLMEQIRKDFGSFGRFQRHFSEAAEKVEGGGWAILVWSPRAHRLEILQAEKHQNLTQWDVIPLLVLDVWEHAYYLKYQNNRKEYIRNWWKIVYWPEVEKRYQVAKQVMWKPY